MPGSQRRGRPVLSRDRILIAAMRLVDTEGLDALTMRRLADDLGVRPVSIYRHVPDKAALVAGLVDMMLSEIRHGAPQGDWRQDMRVVMRSFRQSFLAHPEIAQISHLHLSPEMLYPHYEKDLQTLVSGGFSLSDARLAFAALRSFTNGFVRARRSGIAPPSSEAFPISAAADVRSAVADQAAFEYGLDRLIEGIDQHQQSQAAQAGR